MRKKHRKIIKRPSEKTQIKLGSFRIIPLGGLEEVGRNMTLIEFDKKIIILDIGLRFPEENMPGIDYIIPNTSYLKGKEKNILGVFITHGHYDHIGAIPYLIEKIGNPPIYAMPLSRGIILKRQEDFPEKPKLNIHEIKTKEVINLDPFKIEFFRVNHNIPDTIGIVIQTPIGTIIYTPDFKFDFTPVNDIPADLGRMAQIGNKGVLVLLSDSTDAEESGHSISEKEVGENLERIFETAKGRIIAATFASLIGRIQQMIDLAIKYDRKIAVDGYSMRSNIEISKVLGYVNIPKGALIKPEEIHKYSPSKILIICTGAQGEGTAVLMRIATKEHRFIRIQEGDSVIFSSSVIPGHERAVQGLKDMLRKQGAKVFHYGMMDIHSGGHARVEDLKMMLNLIRPKFFIPVHGYFSMLKAHAEIAESMGIPKENIVIASNGSIIEVLPQKISLSKEKAPANYVMVDGLGIGDIGEVVLRDRQMMARDGMFVIILILDSQTGRLRNEPDIISRGFIYMKESKKLLDDTKRKVKEIVEEITANKHPINVTYLKDNIRDRIGQFLFSKTERRPMILPVIIEI